MTPDYFDGTTFMALTIGGWNDPHGSGPRSQYQSTEWLRRFFTALNQFRYINLRASGILLPPIEEGSGEAEVSYLFGLPVKHTDAVDKPVFTFEVQS